MIRSRTPTPRYPLSPYPSPAGSPILPSGAVNADLELPVTAVLQSALVVLAHRMEVQARDFARRDRRAKALPEFHCPVPGCDKKFTRSFNLQVSSGSGSPCRDKSLRETSGPSTTTDHDLFPPAGGASTTSNKDAAPLPDVLKAIPLETQCSTSINDLTTQIAGVLLVKARYKRLLASRGDDAQKLLDWLQQLLDIPDLESSLKNNIIVATQRLCKKSGLYPTCYSLTGVEFDGKYPIAAGSFADVYKGKLQGKVVCVKVIRLYQTSQVDYFLKVFLIFSIDRLMLFMLCHFSTAQKKPLSGVNYRIPTSFHCMDFTASESKYA
ncbi:hypothetical protein DXG01_010771 [Tephrocybe rancida]|nr:hypothetical protein DXG01_010771 [Tephrocybe rancida]